MFIEKYQPYTNLIITYNGEEITENNLIYLPNIVNGEYKINLDAIGYDNDNGRGNLPFTRNDITWWLVDTVEGLITKEINVDDEVGTKFSIDDSGTLSIISSSYSPSENDNIIVLCVLGKPHTLNADDFDFDTEIFGSATFPFASGESGGSDTTFPTFTQDASDNWSCDLTYSRTHDLLLSDGVNNIIPCVVVRDTSSWSFGNYMPNGELVQNSFDGVPETVNYGFRVVPVATAPRMALFFADNGICYNSRV